MAFSGVSSGLVVIIRLCSSVSISSPCYFTAEIKPAITQEHRPHGVRDIIYYRSIGFYVGSTPAPENQFCRYPPQCIPFSVSIARGLFHFVATAPTMNPAGTVIHHFCHQWVFLYRFGIFTSKFLTANGLPSRLSCAMMYHCCNPSTPSCR